MNLINNCWGYADDIVIICNSIEELKKANGIMVLRKSNGIKQKKMWCNDNSKKVNIQRQLPIS